MRRVRLRRSGLSTSRLGFGTSRLHHVSARLRERLLRTALDVGIVHIDTAPLYGDTIAEIEIGKALRKERDRVVIVTKYGLPPSAVLAAVPAIGTPYRAVRALARRVMPLERARPPITAAGLRAGVESSLRRLGTEYLDAVLLHEPGPDTVRDVDEIAAELDRLRCQGMVRHAGLAGPWGSIAALGPAVDALGEILQTGEAEWPEDAPPDISYGALSGGVQSLGAPSVSGEAAADRLRAALRRRPEGVVLVSTTSPAHLARLAEIAESAES